MIRFLAALLAAAALFSHASAGAAQLAPQPTPIESFDSGTLHVDRYGSGAHAIVFVPGLGCGPWEFYEQIAHFSPQYSVYAVTLPGFDGRAASKQTPLFDAFSNDFMSMLDVHHIVKPVVVGHSLGGTLSIYLAERHSDKLAGVVATDGLPVFPTLALATPQARDAAAAQVAGIATMSPADMLAYQTRYMQTIGTVDAQLAPKLAALSSRSDNAAVAAWMGEDLRNDLRPALKDITVPLLEIMPYDAASPAAKQYTQAQTLGFYKMLLAGDPHADVQAIDNARHFVMLDQPAAYDAMLTRFLESVWK